MERGLTSCDRVLIICTEEYIRKANTLKGGVGYERMIVTTEVARNLGTKKFIPVLRSSQAENLPKFLGVRIYVDFRADEIDNAQYEILLRTLLGAPKHTKPPLGESPYQESVKIAVSSNQITVPNSANLISQATGDKLMEGVMAERPVWPYHWHRAVHEHCGNKLYLILLKFVKGSIFFKKSVLNDVLESGISDYMSFHLYSHWDLLLRVWADKGSYEKLRQNFSKNLDILHEKPVEFSTVDELTYLPDQKNDQIKDINLVLQNTPLRHLADVQKNGEQSEHFRRLKDAGLILEDTVRFDPQRIQFYITIRSMHPLDSASMERAHKLIRDQTEIFNKSIYVTSGSPTRAVVKGQVQTQEYYAINDLLQAITKELARAELTTETMLVASRAHNESTTIDFNRADGYISEKQFNERIPEASKLSYGELRKLEATYFDIRERLSEDKHDVLVRLLRAKITNSPETVREALSFFGTFEERMKLSLVPVVLKEYEPNSDWQKIIDELKKKEGLESKTVGNFLFGDLCKLYKRIVLEKKLIDIGPLSNEKFSAIMNDAPTKRNEFSHKAPDMKRWDELFSFCCEFIPIHSRIMNYLDGLQTKQQ